VRPPADTLGRVSAVNMAVAVAGLGLPVPITGARGGRTREETQQPDPNERLAEIAAAQHAEEGPRRAPLRHLDSLPGAASTSQPTRAGASCAAS